MSDVQAENKPTEVEETVEKTQEVNGEEVKADGEEEQAVEDVLHGT